MLTKEQLLDEAQKQKQALSVMGRWRSWLFVLTTCFVVVAAFGLQRSVAFGAICVALAVACFVCLLVVNLAIRNGRRNVERMLDSLKSPPLMGK